MKRATTKTRFITFYSYKGGVGRTLALANCARALAQQGKSVVIIDFDLEAPGLDHFDAFQPKSPGRIRRKQPSLLGFAEYILACRDGHPPESLGPYLHRCKGKKGDRGNVWLMPAGRHGGAEYQRILSFEWDRFYRESDGFKVMENFRGHLIDEFAPDYVLMDARTGLSEMGGIATHQLADMVVLLFNLNRQNLRGIEKIHNSLGKLSDRPLMVLAATPIPAMPTGSGTPFRKKMDEISRSLSKAVNSDNPVIIPYQPVLAWDERILVDQDDDPFDFDHAYRRLLAAILAQFNDPDAILDHAMREWRGGDFSEAIRILRNGLEEHSDNAGILNQLASLLMANREHKEAVTLLEKASVIEPDNIRSWFNLALSRGALKDPSWELETYDHLLDRFADQSDEYSGFYYASALLRKGQILRNQLSQPARAVAAFSEVSERFSNSKQTRIRYICLQALIGKMQALGSEHETLHDAIGTVSEILRRFGKDDHFRADCMFARLNEISFKYKLDGDLSAAIAAYEVFLAICRAEDSEQQKGLRLYALVNGAEHLILNGQFDKARTWLNEALPLASVRDEEFAVISFLLWLVDPSYPLERVLKSIEELAPDVDFGFEYGELREFVAKLEPEIREVALAIIGFFDDHHTVGKLKEALARILPA